MKQSQKRNWIVRFFADNLLEDSKRGDLKLNSTRVGQFMGLGFMAVILPGIIGSEKDVVTILTELAGPGFLLSDIC